MQQAGIIIRHNHRSPLTTGLITSPSSPPPLFGVPRPANNASLQLHTSFGGAWFGRPPSYASHSNGEVAPKCGLVKQGELQIGSQGKNLWLPAFNGLQVLH
ncbi:hypothetical protein CC78DRAFT_579752 [Lojkania enalia]|uniref:Uncharacterized protein n=1 Tax=Lojkania enalia TaxID=147567 RepID=A0A9P4KCD2_9PLEO|nr:hypothetical protein CC78DRAFT_579752 [Didymosphaeria enalia]